MSKLLFRVRKDYRENIRCSPKDLISWNVINIGKRESRFEQAVYQRVSKMKDSSVKEIKIIKHNAFGLEFGLGSLLTPECPCCSGNLIRVGAEVTRKKSVEYEKLFYYCNNCDLVRNMKRY